MTKRQINSYTVSTNSEGINVSSSSSTIVPLLTSISVLILFGLDLMPVWISLSIACIIWFFYFIRIHIKINTKTQKIWKAVSIFGKPVSVSFYLNLDRVKVTVLEVKDTEDGSIGYNVYAIHKTNKEKLFFICLGDKEEVFLFESMLKEVGYYDFEIQWRKT